MEIVNINKTKAVPPTQDIKEALEYLVFHNDGSVSIQTQTNIYFFATAHYYAARELSRLLKGRQTKLEYGVPQNRILHPDQRPEKLCVKPEKIIEALEADEVTSNWPGVTDFFPMLKAFYDN